MKNELDELSFCIIIVDVRFVRRRGGNSFRSLLCYLFVRWNQTMSSVKKRTVQFAPSEEKTMRSLIRSSTFVAAFLALLAASSSAFAGGGVVFDQAQYDVQPGQTFQAQVRFDSDNALAGYQSLGSGLWTFGMKVSFPVPLNSV